MKNLFQLTFTLKQHTPLIHFQHDQHGATLRATELKPKLDKFLIQQMGGWEQVPKAWKIPSQDTDIQALNYKIKILANSKNEHVSGVIENYYRDRRGNTRREKFPSFFGLMGEDGGRDSKAFTFYDQITVSIFCLQEKLLDKIKNGLGTFFIKTNFGNRQSKGFGSFYPAGTSTYPIPGLQFKFTVDVKEVYPSRLQYTDGTPPIAFFRYVQLFLSLIHI